MESAKLILGIILAVSGIVFLFLANHQYWELQFEVNAKLPEGQKFDPLFWTLFKRLEFRRLHRAVLPNSPRPKRALRFAIIGFALFFSGAALVSSHLLWS
jgi:uncharacterized membrane protein